MARTKPGFIGTLIALLLLSFGSVSADCAYETLDQADCMINGETRTNSCQGWSDTSSWSLPSAYDGVCLGGDITLSDAQKDRINTIIIPLLEVYSEDNMYLQPHHFTLNDEGKDFVNDIYFPAIVSIIQDEVEKTTPNLKRLAILYYLSSIVGYDYSILKLS